MSKAIDAQIRKRIYLAARARVVSKNLIVGSSILICASRKRDNVVIIVDRSASSMSGQLITRDNNLADIIDVVSAGDANRSLHDLFPQEYSIEI